MRPNAEGGGDRILADVVPAKPSNAELSAGVFGRIGIWHHRYNGFCVTRQDLTPRKSELSS